MEPLQSYGSSKKSIFLRFSTALRVESEYTQNVGSLDCNQIPMGTSAGTHLVLGSGPSILFPPSRQDACSGLLSAGEVKWYGWVTWLISSYFNPDMCVPLQPIGLSTTSRGITYGLYLQEGLTWFFGDLIPTDLFFITQGRALKFLGSIWPLKSSKQEN